MSVQTPKVNARAGSLENVQSYSSPMKPGKSILYTIDANNGVNMDYLHKNNATIAAHAAYISSQASAGKKISLEDISAAAKKRARL